MFVSTSLPLLLIYAVLLGISMKLADLFDEHGMRWFKGDAIIFGVLWGAFGSLLVLSRTDIANVTVAMVLAFIVRMRTDYRNHAIADVIILITFLWKSTFNVQIFSIFFATFVVFGGLRDYLGDVRKKMDWFYKLNEIVWYYTVPSAVYGLLTGNWVIFAVFTTAIISYDLVKYGLFYLKMYNKL